VKRAGLAAIVVAAAVIPAPVSAQPTERMAVVLFVRGASMPDLLEIPQLRALATSGGVALMNGRSGAHREVRELLAAYPERADGIAAAHVRGVDSIAPYFDEVQLLLRAPMLLMIVATSPSVAAAADGDELGTVIAAWGDPTELLEANGEPKALTSDSTRRAGVVADVDPAATVAEWLGLPDETGAPIERTGEPAPLGLYQRYLQQRRLAVPAATVSWGAMMVFGLAAVVALALRRRLSRSTLGALGALAFSLPWLAIGLLLVGHLPSLTVTSVVPFLVALVAAGVVFTRRVAARFGIFVALAGTGGVILAILAIEAALGWPAAVTPLAGGGQLDGGRFFGMPNIEIGIVLGSAVFVAHRIRIGTGFLLLAACALVVGSPWTGSNVGAAITLFAAAGLWLAIRRRRPWWLVVLLTGAITAIGMAAIALMHRYLTERSTHVSALIEDSSSVAGVVDRFVDRLGIGIDQLADTPVALIPVVGTLVLLIAVLRPPAGIAQSFEGHDAWRDAVLVLLLGSIVAYFANDTGAAAVGFGFGFALSGLLGVSLAVARGKMS
jgi:hypothetical protein